MSGTTYDDLTAEPHIVYHYMGGRGGRRGGRVHEWLQRLRLGVGGGWRGVSEQLPGGALHRALTDAAFQIH